MYFLNPSEKKERKRKATFNPPYFCCHTLDKSTAITGWALGCFWSWHVHPSEQAGSPLLPPLPHLVCPGAAESPVLPAEKVTILCLKGDIFTTFSLEFHKHIFINSLLQFLPCSHLKLMFSSIINKHYTYNPLSPVVLPSYLRTGWAACQGIHHCLRELTVPQQQGLPVALLLWRGSSKPSSLSMGVDCWGLVQATLLSRFMEATPLLCPEDTVLQWSSLPWLSQTCSLFLRVFWVSGVAAVLQILHLVTDSSQSHSLCSVIVMVSLHYFGPL